MTKTIQQLHLEAIESSNECGGHTGHSVMVITDKAAEKCEGITVQTAIEFAEWIFKINFVKTIDGWKVITSAGSL